MVAKPAVMSDIPEDRADIVLPKQVSAICPAARAATRRLPPHYSLIAKMKRNPHDDVFAPISEQRTFKKQLGSKLVLHILH